MKFYEYDELVLLIYKRHMSIEEVARRIGATGNTLRLKLNGKVAFTLDDVYAIAEVLDIAQKEIYKYFPKRAKANKQEPLMPDMRVCSM